MIMRSARLLIAVSVGGAIMFSGAVRAGGMVVTQPDRISNRSPVLEPMRPLLLTVQATAPDASEIERRKQAIYDFVVGDYLGQGRAGTNDRPNLYADRVKYYKRGDVPRRHVIEDRAVFHKRWTKRTFTLIKESFQVEAGPDDVIRTSFRFEFDFENNRDSVRGMATTRLGIRMVEGQYTIVSEEGEVQRRPAP